MTVGFIIPSFFIVIMIAMPGVPEIKHWERTMSELIRIHTTYNQKKMHTPYLDIALVNKNLVSPSTHDVSGAPPHKFFKAIIVHICICIRNP
jgi:hypothetical protein